MVVEVSRDVVVVGRLGISSLVDALWPSCGGGDSGSLGLGGGRWRGVDHVAGGGDSEVDNMVIED